MSRWSAPKECYLMTNDDRPVAGPFSRTMPLITLIDRLYHQSGRKYAYYNGSRYSLGKHKIFGRNKAGDVALKAAVQHPDLEAVIVPLLGRQGSGLGAGYENPDWAAIDAVLAERGIRPDGYHPPAPQEASGHEEKSCL